MASKVKVYGKAQNRTALGIANAYLVMYPHAKLEDLNKAFPMALNKWAKPNYFDKLFMDINDAKQYADKEGAYSFWHHYFEKPEEVLTLQDGTQVCFYQKWSKGDYDQIVEHAKLYDIEIAEFRPREGFQKGGFRLEYLNGYVPPVPPPPVVLEKKSKWWLWLLLLLLLLIGLLLFLLLGKKQPETVIVEKVVIQEVIVKDTVYVQLLAEIERNFNAAQFIQGKADLSEDAKFVLHDLAKLLSSHPELKLRIVGHTSKEGTEDFNQKLSEERAKATFDFLVNERSIEKSRLEFKGVGSSQPIDENQLDVNRRTEFIVIE